MHFDTATRQRWMRSAGPVQPGACCARGCVRWAWRPTMSILRAPEIGLVQVQARMGGTGERFFPGDATLTRAVDAPEQRPARLQLGARARQRPRRTLRGERRAIARANPFPDADGNPDFPAGSGPRSAHCRASGRSQRQPGRLLYPGSRR